MSTLQVKDLTFSSAIDYTTLHQLATDIVKKNMGA